MSDEAENKRPEPWRVKWMLRDRLAEALGETEATPLWHLYRVVCELGGEAVVDLLRETLEVEQAGGMLTRDGSRKRTRGGVFFELAKRSMTPEQRARLFPTRGDKSKQRKQGAAIAAGSAPANGN